MNNPLRKGNYPKSFCKSTLARFLHDNLIDISEDYETIKKIRNLYDLIFSLQIEIENNKISEYNRNIISNFTSIENLLSYYFTNIRNLLIKIKARDDYIVDNDHIFFIHLKCMKHHIKTNKIKL